MSAHFPRYRFRFARMPSFQGFPEVEDNLRGFPIPVKYDILVVNTTILLIKLQPWP